MLPGPKPKYRIVLFGKEERELRQLIGSRKTPQGKFLRAMIVLSAHEHPEWSNQQIARHVGCTDRAVRKWRQRWVETKNLDDLPRPGAPRRFSPRGPGASHRPGLQSAPRQGQSVKPVESG